MSCLTTSTFATIVTYQKFGCSSQNKLFSLFILNFLFYSPILLSKQYSHFCFCLNQAWCTSHVHLIQSTRNISFLKFAFMIYWAFLVAIYDQREGTHHDRLHKDHASWLIVFLELKYYTNIWYFQTYAKRDMVFTDKIGMYIEEIDTYNTENKLHIIKSST